MADHHNSSPAYLDDDNKLQLRVKDQQEMVFGQSFNESGDPTDIMSSAGVEKMGQNMEAHDNSVAESRDRNQDGVMVQSDASVPTPNSTVLAEVGLYNAGINIGQLSASNSDSAVFPPIDHLTSPLTDSLDIPTTSTHSPISPYDSSDIHTPPSTSLLDSTNTTGAFAAPPSMTSSPIGSGAASTLANPPTSAHTPAHIMNDATAARITPGPIRREEMEAWRERIRNGSLKRTFWDAYDRSRVGSDGMYKLKRCRIAERRV